MFGSGRFSNIVIMGILCRSLLILALKLPFSNVENLRIVKILNKTVSANVKRPNNKLLMMQHFQRLNPKVMSEFKFCIGSIFSLTFNNTEHASETDVQSIAGNGIASAMRVGECGSDPLWHFQSDDVVVHELVHLVFHEVL